MSVNPPPFIMYTLDYTQSCFISEFVLYNYLRNNLEFFINFKPISFSVADLMPLNQTVRRLLKTRNNIDLLIF